ncbi:hypothetical protein BV372_22475 [Nostoc sp. T09]|uniref:hypothetical protein n=1 Tax=Nostoc sp. T09 TaxID=1932621 RepID=UPI000A37279D|nr:hypothetical protein [Nostoc sp. T09]OUL29866.1 hypothetical protein BV372_22475 [Nostoc sp. T09]
MNHENFITQEIPDVYILAVLLLVSLIIETCLNWRKNWAIPAMLVYGTVGLWYFVEIIYTPDNYLSFSTDIVELGFSEIIIFLIAFRLLVPYFTKQLTPKTFNTLPQFSLITMRPEHLLSILASIWLLILLLGLSQVNWNVIDALLPLRGRSHSTFLFTRAAVGSSSIDFIMSSLSYSYTLICSFFGVLLLFQKQWVVKVINLSLIIISWPMFIFSGTRNSFLAMVVPTFLSYLIVSKQKWWLKLFLSLLGFISINYILTVIIAFRNVGFENYLSQIWQTGEVVVPETKHEGLNMAQELFYINSFLQQGSLSLHYGYDYLVEALNWVPRFLWPDKPFIGLDYAQLRAPGKEGLGITATVSRGLIGGGVMNFGFIFGPVAPAFLMAIWSGIIARFWSQRYSILRFALFLVGLGITPNLGRDFTILVLWPMIFGYILILYIEGIERKRLRKLNSLYQPISKFN